MRSRCFGGAIAVFVALDAKRKLLSRQKQKQEEVEAFLKNQSAELKQQRESLHSKAQAQLDSKEALQRSIEQFEQQKITYKEHQDARLHEAQEALKRDIEQFEKRTISYKELQEENNILKRDLRNLNINVRKLAVDNQAQVQNQALLDQKTNELGARYMKDNVKWINQSLTANNFTASKQRLLDAIERCRDIGVVISQTEESGLLADLKQGYELAVRAAFDREEQARIKAQMREEMKREKEKEELERKHQQLQRERDDMKAAVDIAVGKALAEAKDQHSEEIEQLRFALNAKQAEIDANQRAISQAQITKLGHVYVISNIGSFGEGVYKVGMTRRLEPEIRVNELGAASVPFPFDIHMMIKCNNAPILETELHRKLFKTKINKANPRKEFFRTDLDTIKKIVAEHGAEIEYRTDNLIAVAEEYHQSLSMHEDDQQFIESVYSELGDEGELVEDEVS